ncbi:hypothetical protein OA805_00670 [Citrobacter freundii]|nr:hypothetical protein [Citrobacter freundii]MDN4290562.1 hypothetical protein [Citrobacter freundii]
MSDKSHISLEQHVCLVCGTAFDTGAILLDKRLRASMERHTATGWGLCPEHQKLSDDGFVALVECDPQRSGSQAGGRMKPEQAPRWPVQIPPPVATPNSPGKTGWIMTTQCRWRCVRRPL